MGCLTPRKRAKTMKSHAIVFLAPFRADRATAASDIILRITANDLRQSGGVTAQKTPVYAWSAFSL